LFLVFLAAKVEGLLLSTDPLVFLVLILACIERVANEHLFARREGVLVIVIVIVIVIGLVDGPFFTRKNALLRRDPLFFSLFDVLKVFSPAFF